MNATNRPYWLWLGTLYTPAELALERAASLAAHRWQACLIRELARAGQAVEQVGFLPAPAWPRGPLRVRGREEAPVRIPYWNLPAIRHAFLGSRLSARAEAIERSRGSPTAVLSYNAGPAAATAARNVARRLGVPWIPVLADVIGSERQQEARIAASHGRVVLSWKFYQEAPCVPKLHMDGGIIAREYSPPAGKAILYAGAVSAHGGLEMLIGAFLRVRDPEARLWICGKGDVTILRKKSTADQRVYFLGVLSQHDLERRMQMAAVFANPRPPNLYGNEHNFPSKLLEYLGYGKPVVSSWTGGLAPEYRGILIVPKEWGEMSFAVCLEEALGWSDSQRAAYRQRIDTFVEGTGRTWEAQAQKLIAFVRNDAGGGSCATSR